MAPRRVRVGHAVRRLLTSNVTWFWYHMFWACVWTVTFPFAMTIWKESVPFLMFVSMQTALGGSLAGFTTALGARKADPDDVTG